MSCWSFVVSSHCKKVFCNFRKDAPEPEEGPAWIITPVFHHDGAYVQVVECPIRPGCEWRRALFSSILGWKKTNKQTNLFLHTILGQIIITIVNIMNICLCLLHQSDLCLLKSMHISSAQWWVRFFFFLVWILHFFLLKKIILNIGSKSLQVTRQMESVTIVMEHSQPWPLHLIRLNGLARVATICLTLIKIILWIVTLFICFNWLNLFHVE